MTLARVERREDMRSTVSGAVNVDSIFAFYKERRGI